MSPVVVGRASSCSLSAPNMHSHLLAELKPFIVDAKMVESPVPVALFSWVAIQHPENDKRIGVPSLKCCAAGGYVVCSPNLHSASFALLANGSNSVNTSLAIDARIIDVKK